jgi:hypothetical protein
MKYSFRHKKNRPSSCSTQTVVRLDNRVILFKKLNIATRIQVFAVLRHSQTAELEYYVIISIHIQKVVKKRIIFTLWDDGIP